MNNRKLILYIAASLDGYIATNNDSLDFLSIVAKEGEDYGYAAFTQTVDTVIMGRKTYEKVLAMGYDYPHPDKRSYIITRTPRPAKDNITFYTGDLKELVAKLKGEAGKNIYCDGGAEIVNMLMQDGLIDEFIISTIPIFLGSGRPLFHPGNPQQQLTLVKSVSFDTGLVQSHYIKKLQ